MGGARNWQKAYNQVEVVVATIYNVHVHVLQLYFISSCDSTAIGFKQDELCFSELFCYMYICTCTCTIRMSSESCETATVSYKNCHKRF